MITRDLSIFVSAIISAIMKNLGRLIENTSELMDNLLQVDTYLSGDNEEDYKCIPLG